MTTINTIQKLINNGEKSEEEILDEIRILLNKNNDNKMNEICKWLKIKYGDDNLCGNLPNLKGLNNMISSIESSGISPPWDYLSLGTENKDYSQVYSMFPIVDELAWEFYCMQESQM